MPLALCTAFVGLYYAGVPANLHVLSTTDWMPYSWSINNVVFAENVHTALGYWQAGRPEEAFRLVKSALITSPSPASSSCPAFVLSNSSKS